MEELLKFKKSYLKRIQDKDIPQIVNWLNDPNFNKLLYQGWETVTTESFSKQILEEEKIEDAEIPL